MPLEHEQRAHEQRCTFAGVLTQQFAGRKVAKIHLDHAYQCMIEFDDGSLLKIESSVTSYEGHHELEIQNQNIRYDFWE